MNDMCFSRCLIKKIEDRANMKVLTCLTKVPTENGLVDTSLAIYMKEDIFNKKNEKDTMIAINKELNFIGKTEVVTSENNIRFNMLVQHERRIKHSSQNFSVEAKLFDIQIEQLVMKRNKERMEIICKYECSKYADSKIIVSVNGMMAPLIKENSSYNISGNFLLRNGKLPVIEAKTFVPDIYVDDNVYIRE